MSMRKKTNLSPQVAIICAGPYGLAAAAHLRAADIETCVFGEPMEFWENQMPVGMLLRSSWDACHIADPHRASTLDCYSASQSVAVPKPVMVEAVKIADPPPLRAASNELLNPRQLGR